jgi:hypothetical protein
MMTLPTTTNVISEGSKINDTYKDRINSKSLFGLGKGMYPGMMPIFGFLSLITPFLLVFLMVMISVINSNIKGLIYLIGIVLLFFITLMFQNLIQSKTHISNNYCNVFSISQFNIPSFNSALYLFTIIYVLLPMISMHIINFPLIIIFMILYVSDVIIKINSSCTTPLGIVMGSILGIFFGIAWYLIIKYAGQSGLLYYDDLVSNKIACSRPTKQKFKCNVYKNGELIQSI